MLKAYKYELVQNVAQRDFLNRSFGCSRVVYNHCLQRRTELWADGKQRISAFDLCKEVVQLKKTEEYKWLAEVDHQTLCCSVMNLQKAFTGLFGQKKGFPRFKSKYGRQSCQFTQGVKVDFVAGKVNFPKIGWINARISREFEGRIKTVTVTRNAVGKYHVSILTDNGMALPAKRRVTLETAVGIDAGLDDLLVASDGVRVPNPRFLETTGGRIAVLQKRASGKKKGSNRRNRANKKVAKEHEKTANRRRDFLHKLTTNLVKNHDSVCVEDLNIAGMLKNHRLSRAISGAAWGEMFRQIGYKTDWYGKNMLPVDRFYPSSRLCTCGVKNSELKLSQRTWTCGSCGRTHDRDLHSARNIRDEALRQYFLRNPGEGIPEVDVELPARGGAKKRQCTDSTTVDQDNANCAIG